MFIVLHEEHFYSEIGISPCSIMCTCKATKLSREMQIMNRRVTALIEDYLHLQLLYQYISLISTVECHENQIY